MIVLLILLVYPFQAPLALSWQLEDYAIYHGPFITNYTIYYGVPGQLTNRIQVGLTNYTLIPTNSYAKQFRVTSTDTNGVESLKSNIALPERPPKKNPLPLVN